MKKRLISAVLSLALCLGLAVPAWAAGPTFTDVPTSHWAYSFVERAAENGWVTGVGDNKFAPNDTLTFSQFYTMIVPVFAPDEFAAYQTPSGSPWWQPYMYVGAEYLQARTITLDTMDYGLGPARTAQERAADLEESINQHANEAISRSDAVSIMWRVLKKTGLDEKVPGVEEVRAELEASHGYFYLIDETTVPVCYAAGLIAGDENGNLNLEGYLTRAEGCTMLCGLVDYVTKNGGTVASNSQGTTTPSTPSDTTKPSTPTDTTLGQKLSSGATAAAGVKSTVGKNDAYPTYGNSDVVSNNGYFTGATNVDIGNAKLVYELLDMVNEVRVAEGHEPLTWVSSDASEEHTCERVTELITDFSHDRPKGKFSGEVIGKGQTTAAQVFNDWMNSPLHKQTLMSDSYKYLSAARVVDGRTSYWIICVWDDWCVKLAETWSSRNYDRSEILGN